MSLVFLKFFTRCFRPRPARARVPALPAPPTIAPCIGMPTLTDLRAVKGQARVGCRRRRQPRLLPEASGVTAAIRKPVQVSQRPRGKVIAVAVLTSAPGNRRRAHCLAASGWRMVSIPWETVVTCHGTRKLANADTQIAFELGTLSSISECDAVIIGTGDGNLATSCAAGLHRTHRRTGISVHTLSVAGATTPTPPEDRPVRFKCHHRRRPVGRP